VLVENSLRHGAGQVGLTVRTATRGSGAMVVLEVSDEGPGVPEGLVAHVFDRGVSTASSTGIGLGLARAFIEADGGRLELRRAVPPIFAIFLAVGQTPAVVGPEPPVPGDRATPDGPASTTGPTPAGTTPSGTGSTDPTQTTTTAASPAGR
jgi:signal transduction histidine kinase